NSEISLKTKLRLLDCLVLPMYGCETWTLNKADISKLQAFGMKCLHMILNVSWRDHVTNSEIARRASRSEGCIVHIVQRKQHTWLGHVLRTDGNRLLKMSIQAYAHSTRYQGRPRKGWVDSVLERRGLDLKTAVHVAYNREEWLQCMSGAYDQ